MGQRLQGTFFAKAVLKEGCGGAVQDIAWDVACARCGHGAGTVRAYFGEGAGTMRAAARPEYRTLPSRESASAHTASSWPCNTEMQAPSRVRHLRMDRSSLALYMYLPSLATDSARTGLWAYGRGAEG